MYVNEMQPTQLIQYPFFPSFGIKGGGHFHGLVKQILYRVCLTLNWDRMLICFQWSGISMNYMQDIFKMTRPPNHLIWPTNDQQWPEKYFFSISHFGACNTYKWPPNDLQMISSDLSWPKNITLFINLTLGACNMSFPRFFGMLNRLHSSDLSLEQPIDLKTNSKSSSNIMWPKNSFS